MSEIPDNEILQQGINEIHKSLILLNQKLINMDMKDDRKTEVLEFHSDELNNVINKYAIKKIHESLWETNNRLIMMETKVNMRNLDGELKEKFKYILNEDDSKVEVIEYDANEFDDVMMNYSIKKINETISEYWNRLVTVHEMWQKL
ncbi:MAG: hypothetical protein Satyrvirus36_11 [Satyrvirus sp.]|uniref:Uncharacterized protein n=1 Tax=Satyrvirus sp. TaxID=2487771 RepID=A0A3G5AIX2_9VIRU|nr:MAG: hypothetical protein Satyrvirus36_11 [Satyrvirus sp.]